MNTATEKNKTAKIAYICIMSFWFVVIIALVIANIIVFVNSQNKISDVSEMIGKYSYFVSDEDKNMTLKLSAKENGKVEVTATRKVVKEDYELVPDYGYGWRKKYYKYFDYESEEPQTVAVQLEPYFPPRSLKIEYRVLIFYGLEKMYLHIENGEIEHISFNNKYVYDEDGEFYFDEENGVIKEDYIYYPQTENKNA